MRRGNSVRRYRICFACGLLSGWVSILHGLFLLMLRALMNRCAFRWNLAVGILILLAAAHCGPPPIRSTLDRAATAAEVAQLWVEPVDATSRDLFYGIGGEELAPDPSARFEFVADKKDAFSYSPGCTVRDSNGLKWTVKFGIEARSEVVASRLIWAAGFHQPPVYYVQSWQLWRDGKVVPQPPARFRPRLPRYEKSGHWLWHQNPFVDTRPYRGLLVLMVMLNNWDLGDPNTAIYDLKDEWDGARRWYVVRDVGASFSRNRGRWWQGTREDLDGFARQGFIDGVKDGHVVFAWNGLHRDLIQDIVPDDVRWIARRLSILTPKQWDDALRAGGYQPQEASVIRQTLQDRIAQAARL